jgi:hypothetical protein
VHPTLLLHQFGILVAHKYNCAVERNKLFFRPHCTQHNNQAQVTLSSSYHSCKNPPLSHTISQTSTWFLSLRNPPSPRYVPFSQQTIDSGYSNLTCAIIKRKDIEKSASQFFSKKSFNSAINLSENKHFRPTPACRHISARLVLRLTHELSNVARSRDPSTFKLLVAVKFLFNRRIWLGYTLYFRATRLTLSSSAKASAIIDCLAASV